MIQKINRLINSENPYMRKMGWFLYDRLHQEVFTSSEIEEMLSMFDIEQYEEQIEKECEKGYARGYSIGYENGYDDGEEGRDYNCEVWYD